MGSKSAAVLRALAEGAPLRGLEVATAAQLDSGLVRVYLPRLERRGLVASTGALTLRVWSISDKGREALQALEKRAAGRSPHSAPRDRRRGGNGGTKARRAVR